MIDPALPNVRKHREIKEVKKILVCPNIDVGKDKDIPVTGRGGP
jgi:hypothetical protein